MDGIEPIAFADFVVLVLAMGVVGIFVVLAVVICICKIVAAAIYIFKPGRTK